MPEWYSGPKFHPDQRQDAVLSLNYLRSLCLKICTSRVAGVGSTPALVPRGYNETLVLLFR
jgi:hypothetical protein